MTDEPRRPQHPKPKPPGPQYLGGLCPADDSIRPPPKPPIPRPKGYMNDEQVKKLAQATTDRILTKCIKTRGYIKTSIDPITVDIDSDAMEAIIVEVLCQAIAEIGGRLAHIQHISVNQQLTIDELGNELEKYKKAAIGLEYDVQKVFGGELFGYGPAEPDKGIPEGLPLWGDHVAITLAAVAVEQVTELKAKLEQVQKILTHSKMAIPYADYLCSLPDEKVENASGAWFDQAVCEALDILNATQQSGRASSPEV